MAESKRKTPIDLASLCRTYTEHNIQTLGAYAAGAETPDDIRLRAIAMLLDRGWGKPVQDNNVKGELKVVIRKMMDGE